MAGIPKEHEGLYFDNLIRTQKQESVLAFIEASYHAYHSNVANPKDDIRKRLKDAYNLFRDNIKGKSDGAGTYSGDDKQFKSQYTLGHELAIWIDSDLHLTKFAERVAKNEITIKDYFDVFFVNYFQPINGTGVHILFSLLMYLNENKKEELTKEEVSLALNCTCDGEAINALFDLLSGTSYFVIEQNKLKINSSIDLQSLITKCNTRYQGKGGLDLARTELNTNEKYADYICSSLEKVERIVVDGERQQIPDSIDSELENNNVFGIHITNQNSALSNDTPHVCIGWSPLGNLSSVSTKQELKNIYLSVYSDSSANKTGANVSQIWMFIDEMKKNDFVVFFDKGTAHIGKVVSDYYYDNAVKNQTSDYCNNRKVEWLKDIEYSELPNEYRKSALAQKSFFRLNSYKPLIKEVLKGLVIKKDEFDDYEEQDSLINVLPTYNFSRCKLTIGDNLIVYGIPGCGKSYYVQNVLLKDYPEENYIRTTFFQDYTNTDFVGQILPVINGEKVSYKFNPGPFTLALEKAIRCPDEKVALVIEELNRGSAASIFGDIFQLLDRKNGLSEYSILNINIINYLNEKFENQFEFKEIRIPGNMFIYATMNTSDQNVFTLDTAFKRRWKFFKLLNEFKNDHLFKDSYVPGANITWEDLVKAINEYILYTSNGLNGEDKQLGVYFVDNEGMRDNKDVPSDPQAIKDFSYKVLEYLWSDVAKYNRDKWFKDAKSLDELIKRYESDGIKVFNDDVFKK